MAKVLTDSQHYTDIADAIRAKNGTENTYKPSEMAVAIEALPIGGDLPEDGLLVRGGLYTFYGGNWDWFIEAYGSRIITKDLQSTSNMFMMARLPKIPFTLNYFGYGYGGTGYQDINQMFYSNQFIEELPKTKNLRVGNMNSLFDGCSRLREINKEFYEDIIWDYCTTQTSAYMCSRNKLFYQCYSLRSVPNELLAHVNPLGTYNNSYFHNGFRDCYALDELVDLPLNYTAEWTSSAFANSFINCKRLKSFTFAMPDGQPYVMKWKNQTIDLTGIGCGASAYNMTAYNSGITADKEVKDDATYQALKDDPDWFTAPANYSRYDHDSAVATINSLPDTSAYLTEKGGTNTIKFTGVSGRDTDGGAINTLTEEEIAVATAKGWTITLV